MSTYHIEEVDAAARNLNDLLDVMCEVQFSQDRGATDRRIDSLLWIARDISEGIVRRFDEKSEAAMEKIRGARS